MEHPGSSSPLRVLIRHPPPATTSIAATSTPLHSISFSNPPPQNLNPNPSSFPTPSTSSASSSPIGVVVVGFLASKPSTDLTHLINRLLDDNVFGSGNLEKDLLSSSIPGAMDWFDRRRIGYHHEPETGMVFLHFSILSPSRLVLLSSSTSDGRDEGATSVLEECEAEDLRYMLLMFSVCHVIVFVHEGLRFDIQILKKFRMLQAAKHALTPFFRSQIAPLVSSKQSLANVVRTSSVSLLSLGHDLTDGIRNTARLPLQLNTTEIRDRHAVEDSISYLESSKGLNMKFSVSWCKRALPAAKEVYLKDLPAHYPTSMHNTHLENALLAFNSMVKGAAVKMFTKKLADECTSIWEAGRQLCDAVSLTRKPCLHPRHDVNNKNLSMEDGIIQHSSGYVFLHACACGRSRRMRDDPFDFESANITFNHFTNCENLLPSLSLSNLGNGGSFPPTYWSLRRVGGAGYYEPSKGLLLTGFCSAQKFLMKWTISTDKQTETNSFPLGVTGKSSVVSLNPGPKVMPARNEGKKKSTETKFHSEVQLTSENQRKTSEIVPFNATSISFGKGLPSFTMKKPFAEVVAGTAISESTPFTPKQRKHTKDITDKGIRPSVVPNQNDGRKNANDDHQASQGPEHASAIECSIIPETKSQTNVNPFLQIGTNIVPVDIVSSGEINRTSFSKKSTVYVGFEHECSYGHRFLLSLEHLKDLDSSYSLTPKQHSSTNVSEGKYAETKTGVHGMLDHSSSGKVTSVTNLRKNNKLNEPVATNGAQNHESFTMFSKEEMENIQSVQRLSMLTESVHQLEGKLSHVRLDDGSSAFSLLTRDLPVYMNCPHCNNSAKQAHQKIKFASKISQLQRIFLVTPPFPTVLATCPVIQFEESYLPPTISERKQNSHFSFGCCVILPPESFLTLRLPFIYGVRKDDGILQPLNSFEDKPELTAWLAKGTTLQVLSMGHESNKESQLQ